MLVFNRKIMKTIYIGYHRLDPIVDVMLTTTRQHHHRLKHHVLQSIRTISSSSSIHTDRFLIKRQQQPQQQQCYASSMHRLNPSRKYSISNTCSSNSNGGSGGSGSGGSGGARSDSSDSKYDALGITLFSSLCVLCSGLGAWQVKR